MFDMIPEPDQLIVAVLNKRGETCFCLIFSSSTTKAFFELHRTHVVKSVHLVLMFRITDIL